ncbi:MAG: helix-turn-helix domain-containing protein, partial [Methylosarcina sp.]
MMNKKDQQDISRKLRVLNHAQGSGNVSKTCRYFGISRDTFYQWKKAYATLGEQGLINSKPCPENPKRRTLKAIEEKILYLRTTYHFGPLKISWYLERFHDIK